MRRHASGPLVVATSNAGKLAEFRRMLSSYGFQLSALGDHGLASPEECADSFAGNARIKAIAAALSSGLPSLADDSGLCVDALGGAPGVRTAEFATRPGGRDYPAAMAELARRLEVVHAPRPWRARFVCAVALAWPDGALAEASGEIVGTLVFPPRGCNGHGFDPCFVPDGHGATLAELSAEEKDRLSHRRVAIARLLEKCFT